VGLMIGRSPGMIIGILGILKSGGAYMPIDPEYPRERIDYMMKDSAAKILITANEIASLAKENVFNFHLSSYSDHLAYIIYTSGSSGKPKGVLTMHYNITRVVRDANYIHIEPGDRVLQLSNYAFDGSTFDIYGALLNGAGLVMISKDDVLAMDRLSQIIKRGGVTVFFVTTALFNMLVDMETGCFDRVRKVLFGGERVSLEHSGKLLQYLGKGRIIHVYGPTETTVYAAYYFIDAIDEASGTIPIGKPISGTAIYILDKNANPVPIGVQGELYIGGSGLARGYMNNPELTSDRFYRSYKSYILYKTGDLGRWLTGGNVQFLGRIDRQVKIRGFRVEPGEIQQRLLRHENIKEAIVEAREEKNGERYLCAYYTASPADGNQDLTTSKLREFLSGQLPHYMIPQYFVQLEKIPLNTNGKIDRKLLPEPGISNIRQDAAYVEPLDEMEQIIAGVWKDVLKVDRVGIHDNFFDLGGNSVKIIQVDSKLTETLGIKIPVVSLFQYPTISSLKEHLKGGASRVKIQPAGLAGETQKASFNAGFAVIGMAGRFPGAANVKRYWENVLNGVESITFFTREELAEEGISQELLENPAYVRCSALQADKDRFDAAFFNYSPQEARVMDPQMRVFHECVWEALEDAGYNPDFYDKPVGLYAGARYNMDWGIKVRLFAGSDIMNTLETFQLVNSHFIPTRISYKLNLKGPAVFIQTACSTSLYAIHAACNALSAGDCAMALAGGVSLSGEKKSGYLYQEGLILSPDGHCRAFDAAAGGTMGGEGAAVVLLKPLPQAIEDNDHIYAVIKASGVNNDGSRKVGFSAPSIDGQAEAIAIVYRKAGIPPESISFIETHGTDTTLGDPIELAALKQAFNTPKKGFCALGSVKSNVGHMDSASGAAGFIKAVLALKHRKIPPTLHFETPNTQTDLIDSPFYVNTTLKSWDNGSYPFRAGVSSFGIGGTNVHVVLEEYAQSETLPLKQESTMAVQKEGGAAPPPKTFDKLILLSAKTPAALEKMKENLRDFLAVNRDIPLTDIAYTLQAGRKLFDYKWMALCATIDETVAALAAPGNTEIIGWKECYEKEKQNRVSLPTYPFEVEGQRYWIQGDPFDIENIKHLSPGSRTLKKQNIADWFYLPRWIQSAPVQANSAPRKQEPLCFLVFANNSPLVLKLVQRLQSENLGTGQKVFTVFAGETFAQKGGNEFVIDPRSGDDYDALLIALNRMGVFPHRIVHCWNVVGNDNQPAPWVAGPGFYSLLYLAKAIGKRDFDGDIRIDTLTVIAQEVTGYETIIPGNALILGPLKVIPQEYPYIICRSIDIELPPPGDPREEILVRYIIAELSVAVDSPDTDIAYRNHYRWLKTYEPVRIASPVEETLPLRDQGVYLITGGIGAVGVTLAQYLVERFHARLILTGASPLPPVEQWDHWLGTHGAEDKTSLKIMKIRRLEATGGNSGGVLFFAADVGDKKAMAAVVRKAEETFGPIHGVIHAAGVTRDKSIICPVEETGENEWNRQFRPKIQGTSVLAELFHNKPLDFCLLTSSLSPILGGLGFAAYSAANAFMDAFVYHANRTGSIRWLSINWADWGFKKEMDLELQVGMGASAAELVITPEEGVETFKRVLTLISTPARQAAISSGDLQVRIDRWVKLRSLRKSDSLAAPGASSLKFQGRPHLSTEYAAPRSPMEQAIAEAWKNQFGIDKIGVHDDFFELGGDSLKAISMISKIHKELNARVQLNDFFSGPTVESLAQFITGVEKSGYTSIQSVEKKEYYPLSPAQKRLYLLDRMGNLGTGYNQALAVELQGKPDEGRLEKAFNALVNRHETFRTSFIMADDIPVQRIHDNVEFEIEYLATDEHGQTRTLTKSFIRPFDLSRAPLLRVGLIKEENETHVLLVDMHHIISDGVSHLILVKEFIDLYENKVLPALHLQYKDYSEWHNSIQQQEAIKKQERYWLNELEYEAPVLDIPTDYARPAVQSFEGGAVEGDLTEVETNALNEIVRSEGATLFMGLLAAYTIFLAKISTSEDIPVGCPVAGRGHADLEQIIGMFVNTLVLRNYPLPGQTFLQFLREVKQKTLAAFENQDYPFEELVEKAVKRRDTGRNPLFDVMFVLQNMIRPKEEIPHDNDLERRAGDLKMKLLPKIVTASQFDLVLEAVETGPKISFSLEYCSKLFQPGTIVRFVGYFKKVITSILANPGIEISEIEIISAEEKRRILVEFNDTGLNYPNDKTIHELFAEQAKRTPDSIALVGAGPCACPDLSTLSVPPVRPVCLSYLELNEKSNSLALSLQERGIKPDTIVGIMMERSLEMIIGILGILKSGGAYLPIDPDYPQERIDYMLKDSGARILINKSEIRNLKVESPRRGHPIKNPNDQKINDQNKNRNFGAAFVLNFENLNFDIVSNFDIRISNFNSSNLAYIIYTSGSTGNPKGVSIEHASAVNLLYAMQNEYPLDLSDTYLFKTAYVFDVSVTELFGWYMGGSRLALLEKDGHKDPQAIVNSIERNRVTHINFIPSMFNAFIEYLNGENKPRLSSLKFIFLAGETLLPGLVEKFRALNTGITLENLYGPTESTVYSSKYSLSDWNGIGSIPIGKPLPNIKLYILNEYHYLQPFGIAGELFIGGDGAARGYLNNPELTAEKFIVFHHASFIIHHSILYRTGDRARWLSDGNIEFLGRFDFQVKIRGYRIELGEIENRLLGYNGIKEAVVLIKEDGKGDKYLCAYIVTGRKIDDSELKSYLSGYLPGYMVPSYFTVLERMPLNPNGKVDIKAFPEPGLKSGGEYTPPQNEIEKKLLERWSEILGRDVLHTSQLLTTIGIDDNFFHKGGHSLKAAVLSSKVQKAFNVQLPLAEIFRTPTIRGLSQYIGRTCKEEYLSIEPVEKMEYYELSSAQKRLYVLQQMTPDNTAYNMPQVISLGDGEYIAEEKLENTFRQLIARHESLRTSFHMINNEPVQVIHDEVEFEIEYKNSSTDYTDYTDEKNNTLHQSSFIIHHFIRPFDLSKAPLLRVVLRKEEDNKQLLLVDMHHIISDGLSMEILNRDFMDLFHERPLTRLRVQYKDFAHRQNSLKIKEKITQQKTYWLEVFAGEIPVLNLPLDYPRPAIQSFEGGNTGFVIGKEETSGLKQLALEQGVTLYMVLLAFFNILISRLSGQEDIIVGTPTAGRGHSDLENIIGMFVNTLALRNYPLGEKRFSDFLEEIKTRTLAALENQDYPYEDLVEEIGVIRDAGRNPLFDTFFVLQNIDRQAVEIPGLKMKSYEHENPKSKFDLSLIAVEAQGKLLFTFEYSTKLFKQETIERFIVYFENIVSGVLKNKYSALSSLEIIPEAEKRRILFDFNNTASDYPRDKTIHQLFAEQVEKTADHIALVGAAPRVCPDLSVGLVRPVESVQLSYRQLHE
ncbi:MAG TPA: amino acid adenylation domain-containing protein, partial [Candidatus Deferrimicrobium sp.]|nr:amino acid adenylation domain-containing protein [Candidatus Deferrimicrobium sp.]